MKAADLTPGTVVRWPGYNYDHRIEKVEPGSIEGVVTVTERALGGYYPGHRAVSSHRAGEQVQVVDD